MSPVQTEIAALEERLRLAELGPDAAFFEHALADTMVMVSDGQPIAAKQKVVDAHRPGSSAKFTRVEMRNLRIIDHGCAAVVTCEGTYEGPQSTATLKFMRVWVKTDDRWQIVAGTVSQ
jgi:ketosteroid isomerase-like protein